MRILIATAALLATSCASVPKAADTPADAFFARLTTICGQSFSGNRIAGDESDAIFADADIRAHVRECSDKEIRIAFDVGEDRSRTWIITRTANGLRLKHRHMLKDGTEDPVSQYGGDTVTTGTAFRQEFPADAYSKAMFTREGRSVSNTNVWAFEIEAYEVLMYELSRPQRLFRVSFDLSSPIKATD